jgi:hypothetical protein
MRPDQHGQRVGEIVKVRGIERLEALLEELWPDLFGGG